MTDLLIINEDERRVLYDWAQGDFKSAKVVIAKQAVPVGDHYHNNKDETFFLLTGLFLELKVGDNIRANVLAPHRVFIPRGVYHRFILQTGSILLGVATELFDPNDEIKKHEQSI